MKSHIAVLAAFTGVMLASASASRATVVTYFGEDLQPAATNQNGTINASLPHPNASAAQANFLAQLTGVSTQTFESFTVGTPVPISVAFGSTTATITGSASDTYVDDTANELSVGRFAISGTNFLETDQNFTITFSKPQAAFGFYGVDIGDINGQLTLGLANGASTNITVPNVLGAAANGSVAYEGILVTPDLLFTSVTFGDSAPASDFFAFDDFTIGGPANVQNPNLPEPASLTLIAGATVLLGRRRRSNNAL